MSTWVVALEGDSGKGGRTLISALGFGSPIDDATACVEDRNEVGSASNGIGVGHAWRFGVEVEPADGLAGFVVFNGCYPRAGFSWVFGFSNPSGNHAVVIAEGETGFRLNQWSGRIWG